MNITFFIVSLSGGGAERVVSNLGSYLSKRYKVKILTMSGNESTYTIDKNIKRISLEKK